MLSAGKTYCKIIMVFYLMEKNPPQHGSFQLYVLPKHYLTCVYLWIYIFFIHTCCRRRRMVLFCRWGTYSCSSGSFSAWSFTQFRTYQKSEKLLHLHQPLKTSTVKYKAWFLNTSVLQLMKQQHFRPDTTLFYWRVSFDNLFIMDSVTFFVWRRLTVLATFTTLLIYLQVLFSTSSIFVPTIKEKEDDVLHQSQNLHNLINSSHIILSPNTLYFNSKKSLAYFSTSHTTHLHAHARVHTVFLFLHLETEFNSVSSPPARPSDTFPKLCTFTGALWIAP